MKKTRKGYKIGKGKRTKYFYGRGAKKRALKAQRRRRR